MTNPALFLATIPAGLRAPLLDEYRSIVQNFFERRWSPAELSGGKFSEIVYTILDGHAKGTFAATPSKPSNFVGACRLLENNAHVPRSFQVLIPRLLPALYEIRNNRGVGHVGGDVDPNHMDATSVVGNANWVMAELVRVFHNVSVDDAQAVVDALVEQRIPIVWEVAGAKRILRTDLQLKDQVLVLLASSATGVSVDDLAKWTEYADGAYFRRTLRALHSSRLIEFQETAGLVHLLPPGSAAISRTLAGPLADAARKATKRRKRR